MHIEASGVIDRSAEVVFDFVAVHHLENHPRWDHQIHLEAVTPGPIGVGTVIRRRHTRAGTPTEGSMVCTEFDPPRAMAFRIDDGPVVMFGRQTITPDGPDRCILTISADIPGLPTPGDPMPIDRSVARIRELIEAER